MGKTKTINEMIKKLPPELQKDVFDFVEFLLEKRAKKWAGDCVRIGQEL